MNIKIFKANRFLAALVDGFFMFLITVAFCLAPAISFFREIIDGKFIPGDMIWLILSLFGSFCLWILYLALPSLIFKNATLGMKLNHLVFVSKKYGELRLSHLLFREAIVVVCLVFSLSLSIYSEIFSLVCSEDGKGFFDVFSSIKVVSENAI